MCGRQIEITSTPHARTLTERLAKLESPIAEVFAALAEAGEHPAGGRMAGPLCQQCGHGADPVRVAPLRSARCCTGPASRPRMSVRAPTAAPPMRSLRGARPGEIDPATMRAELIGWEYDKPLPSSAYPDLDDVRPQRRGRLQPPGGPRAHPRVPHR